MSTSIAFVFPGQGAQCVGMGKAMYEACPTFRRSLDGFAAHTTEGLLEVMFDGPEDRLKETRYTQPALTAVSCALVDSWRQVTGGMTPTLTAGHSVGEYAALYAAGSIDLATAARLITRRAQLMSEAPQGTMAAVLGLDQQTVEAIAGQAAEQTGEVVVVANYNTPIQFILSGSPEGVSVACQKASEAGAKRVLPLAVSGAFHSPFMAEAAKAFEADVAGETFADAIVPVITNVDAQPTRDGAALQRKLPQQIDHSVLWLATMAHFGAEGIDTVIEFGPGGVLSGMIKRFDRNITCHQVYDPETMGQALGALGFELPQPAAV
ncbi:MAG: ACP S-malonyltransferase [Cyanobacteria bacterium HKST-UBA04]|nr:ACP S-malonyltransferase [Cyanobacteria bacterium HKST-UBA04]